MPGMADPMDALRSLQPAIDSGDVQLVPSDLFDDLWTILDFPMGEMRLTYVAMRNGHAEAIVQFVRADPVEGVPCFSIGYAVHEPLRGRGLGGRTVTNALAEFQNGFRRTQLKQFYVEAIVSRSNVASNKIAARLICSAPVSITDEHSGESAFQYMKLFELEDK